MFLALFELFREPGFVVMLEAAVSLELFVLLGSDNRLLWVVWSKQSVASQSWCFTSCSYWEGPQHCHMWGRTRVCGTHVELTLKTVLENDLALAFAGRALSSASVVLSHF